MSSAGKRMVTANKVVAVGSVQNGNIIITNTKNQQKSKVILEREKQMKLLKQQFPHVDSMKIHDVLSKVQFDMTLAQKEVEKFRNRNVNYHSSAEQISQSKPLLTINCESNSSETDDPLATEVKSNMSKKLRYSTAARSQQKLRIERNVVKTQHVEEETVFIKEEPMEEKSIFSYACLNHLDESDERVLSFFQNATFEELKFLNTNPDKGYGVAQKIYSLRPFSSWSDLDNKLKKSFSFDLIVIAKEMFSVQIKIDQMLERTKAISQDVEKALQNTPVVTRQPKEILYLLKKPQVDVLNWLTMMHKENVNGILNYSLGTARMLQLIAFLASLKESKTNVKGMPHLVIVPSNIIGDWAEAFKLYCPSLKVFVYHGTKEERTAHRLKFYKGELYFYEVILTTYTVVVHIADEREVFRSMTTDYIIFDETDAAKNINIQLYDSLIKTRALRRLLITSASFQGNPLELISVLYFILPLKLLGDCYLSESSLQKAVRGHLLEGEFTLYEKNVINELNEILKPFILQNIPDEGLYDMSYLVDTFTTESAIAVKEEKVDIRDDDLVDIAEYVNLESAQMMQSYNTDQLSITKNQQNPLDKDLIKKEEDTESSDNEWNTCTLEDNSDGSTSDFEGQKRKTSFQRISSMSSLPKRKRKSNSFTENSSTIQITENDELKSHLNVAAV